MGSIRSVLFERMKINNMHLRNRFIRSATYDGGADRKAHVTDMQVNLYTNLSKGGAGLIITGITYVHPSGQISKFQNSIAGDEFIYGFKRLTDEVHHWGAKIAVQLFHAGREARFPRSIDRVPIAPSFLQSDPYFSGKHRAMTEDEIGEMVSAFGDAARRAREAGFDAVQIHAAHAYLLSQFLSPFTNRREDQWGGNLANRLRLHSEIYKDVRQKIGEDYPLLIKIGVQDGFAGGLEFGEGKVAAESLAQIGFDALEISLGLRGPDYEYTEFRTKVDNFKQEAYFRDWCREIKKNVKVPVMIVGGLRTFELMEEIVRNDEADFISMSRPFILEPGIINDWQRGNRHRAKCISCNKCLEALKQRETLRCIQQGT